MIRIDMLDGKYRCFKGTVKDFDNTLLATLLNSSAGLPTVIRYDGVLIPFDKIVCVAPIGPEVDTPVDPNQGTFDWVKK